MVETVIRYVKHPYVPSANGRRHTSPLVETFARLAAESKTVHISPSPGGALSLVRAALAANVS
jgi:hypothetical protein